MTITRRGLLAGILASAVAPAIVTKPMTLWVPRSNLTESYIGTLEGVRFISENYVPTNNSAIQAFADEMYKQANFRPLLAQHMSVVPDEFTWVPLDLSQDLRSFHGQA